MCKINFLRIQELEKELAELKGQEFIPTTFKPEENCQHELKDVDCVISLKQICKKCKTEFYSTSSGCYAYFSENAECTKEYHSKK